MKDQKALEEIFIKAEKVVSVIKDLTLRPIAYGKLIDIYLGNGSLDQKHIVRTPIVSKAELKTKIKSGPKFWIEELVEEDYFKAPVTVETVKRELSNRGHVLETSTIQINLNRFVVSKKLRRTKQKEKESQGFKWHYVNW